MTHRNQPLVRAGPLRIPCSPYVQAARRVAKPRRWTAPLVLPAALLRWLRVAAVVGLLAAGYSALLQLTVT
jgi:hypothetical protein